MGSTRYLIVGGGLAGGYAVEAIRAKDQQGRIALVTDEPHLPYDRVPLSKQYLMGQTTRDKLFLKDAAYYEQAHVEVIRNHRVVKIEVKSHTATLDDGQSMTYEHLLLATGGRPHRLPIPGNDLPGIRYLRTIEDSEAIQAAISKAKRAVVVGGGFIGCEITAACAQKGLDTTIIEALPRLLYVPIDPETSQWVTEYFSSQGIHVKTEMKAARFIEEHGQVGGIETQSGEKILGDLVTVGIGIAPNVELAKDAGLTVDNGIVVNEKLEVEGMGIYAAGDVARFYSPIFKKQIRVEHYDVAMKHGWIAGANMAGGQAQFNELPYFFSNLFKLRMQVWGDTTQRETIVRRGTLEVTEKGGFAQFYLGQGQVQAYLAINRSFKEARAAQKLIQSGKTIDNPSRLSDEAFNIGTLTV